MTSASGPAAGGAPATGTRAAEVGHFREARIGFKTSEFYAMLLLVVALLIATYADSDDSLGTQDGWLYASIVGGAYILSRGFAKLGVREPDKNGY